VGKDGRVLDVVTAPGGSIPLLDDAALEAARRWVFKPALANGHPVIVWVALRFDFSLR
jgi:TonB family protein